MAPFQTGNSSPIIYARFARPTVVERIADRLVGILAAESGEGAERLLPWAFGATITLLVVAAALQVARWL
jgi:hypothetical protein